MEKEKQKISIWRVLSYFIIYSFIGYIVETVFALINYNVLESRKSFLYGPFCGIYGVGAIIFLLTLRYFNKNNYKLFFAGCLIGAVTEYIISFLGEILFDARWWDYSGKFLNINGRICLMYSIFWGILSLLLMKVINPRVDKWMDWVKSKVNIKLLKCIVAIGSIFMILNFIISSLAMNLFLIRISVEKNLDINHKEKTIEQYNKIYGNQTKAEFIHKFWGNKRMLQNYPNVTIKLRNGSIVLVRDLLPEIKSYFYKFKE